MCPEKILSADARRTRPVVFSEMSLSAFAPEDVPVTYFVGVEVSEHQQSIGCLGRGGSFIAPQGRLSEKTCPHKDFWWS